MALTAYEDFLDSLGKLSVEGVARVFRAPPLSLETADLPAQYPQANIGQIADEGYHTVRTAGGWPHMYGQLIIVLEPVGQNTQIENHKAAIQMADNVLTAFRSIRVSTGVGRGGWNWLIELVNNHTVGERVYWAIIGTLEGYG
jgi:hypothetical protein